MSTTTPQALLNLSEHGQLAAERVKWWPVYLIYEERRLQDIADHIAQEGDGYIAEGGHDSRPPLESWERETWDDPLQAPPVSGEAALGQPETAAGDSVVQGAPLPTPAYLHDESPEALLERLDAALMADGAVADVAAQTASAGPDSSAQVGDFAALSVSDVPIAPNALDVERMAEAALEELESFAAQSAAAALSDTFVSPATSGATDTSYGLLSDSQPPADPQDTRPTPRAAAGA
jgi:hypothetical protein